jgi:hypothetical protein
MNPTPKASLRRQALKWHKITGSLLILPLLWTSTTGMIFTIVKEIGGNRELGKAILHWHTLQIVGLHKIYPFFVGLSIFATLTFAILLIWRPIKR